MKRGAKSINTFLKQVQDSAAGFPRKLSKTTSGKFVQKGIYQNGGNDVSKYEGWVKENTKFNRVMCILMAALNCPQTISTEFHGWRKELITLRELDYFKRQSHTDRGVWITCKVPLKLHLCPDCTDHLVWFRFMQIVSQTLTKTNSKQHITQTGGDVGRKSYSNARNQFHAQRTR